MNLSGLLPPLIHTTAYQRLLDELQARSGVERKLPLIRAARPYVLAALARDLSHPLVVVTGRVDTAGLLVDALRAYAGEPSRILRFPEPPVLFYERAVLVFLERAEVGAERARRKGALHQGADRRDDYRRERGRGQRR